MRLTLVLGIITLGTLLGTAVATCGQCNVNNAFNTQPLYQANHLLFTATVQLSNLPANPTYPIYVYFQGQQISCNKFTTNPKDSQLMITNTISSDDATYNGGWKFQLPARHVVQKPGTDCLIGSHILPIAGSDWAGQTPTWTGTFSSSCPGLQVSMKWTAAHYGNSIAHNPPVDSDYNNLQLPVVSGGCFLNNDDAGTPQSLNVRSFVRPGACGSGGLDFLGSILSKLFTVPDICTSSGGKGEPHFTGGEGSHFDWSGIPGRTYCLISDSDVHINMGMTGHFADFGSEKNKSLTWVRRMGIMWGHHTLELTTRGGADPEPTNGFMESMKADGTAFTLRVGEEFLFADKQISVRYIADDLEDGDEIADLYEVTILNVLTLRLKLRPEVESLRTKEEAWVHFDFELPYAKLSKYSHGVLGQTFRPDFKQRSVGRKLVHSDLLGWDMVEGNNGEGFLDGHFSHYEEPSLTSSLCRYSRFNLAPELEDLATSVGTFGEKAGKAVKMPSRKLGLRPVIKLVTTGNL